MYCGRRHYSLSRISLLRTPDRDRDSNRAMDLEGDLKENPRESSCTGIEIAHALACALGMKLSELIRRAE